MAELDIVERTFLDITETAPLAPGTTKTYRTSSAEITPNTINASTTTGDSAYELVSLEIIPPRNSQGVYEDLRQVWILADNKPLQHYINVPGWGWTLMTPLRNQVWGGPHLFLPFGMPFWQTVRQSGNHPILNTTIKFRRSIQVAVSTVYGTTGAYRIIGKGFAYSAAALANLGPRWNDSVSVQTTDRAINSQPALTFTFSRPGPISLSTWTAMPGGRDQTTIKINPYWRFAFNANTTQPQAAYSFSTSTAVAGGDQNVENDFQDLGFVFAENQNAFLLQGFGVRGVPAPPGSPPSSYPTSVVPGENLARAGWWVDGNLVPEVMGNQGFFLTPGVNDFSWGSLAPQIALDNVFQPIRRYPGELLIYGQNAVPFIGGNGAGVPAYSTVVAVKGVLVER